MRLRSTGVALVLACITCLPTFAAPAWSQIFGQANPPAAPRARPPVIAPVVGEPEEVERLNKWTVGLVGGLMETTDIKFASDIGTVLDDGNDMRVISILSPGSVQNIQDLLYLRGVDAGLVSADTFDEFKKEGKIRNIENRIQYVSQVCVSAFQLLVSADIKTLKDLEGRKVAVPMKGSSSLSLAKKVFERNGVKVQIVETGVPVGMESLKSGEVSAVIGSFAKGGPTAFSSFDAKGGFHLLSVEFDKFIDEYYVPVSLSSEDYPNLIAQGEKVETLGTPVVLAIYNWPRGNDRFRKVERFIQYYFDRFDRLRKPPFHPAWRDVNLAAKVPGWRRYWFAEEVLQKLMTANAAKVKPVPASEQPGRMSRTEQDTLSTLPEDAQKRQFKEFLEWKKKQPQQ